MYSGMNGLNQTIHMLHFIKNPIGNPSKYLGMVGQHLVEILDNDPFLLKALQSKGAKKIYKPSDKSRFMGNHERMVLMSKNDSALFTLTRSQSPKGSNGIELGILNLPEESFLPMLKELTLLANMKWPKLPVFVRMSTHGNINNLKLILFNTGWIEDQYNSVMEKAVEETAL